MGDAYPGGLLALRALDVPFRPELVSISGRSPEPLERAAICSRRSPASTR